LRVKGRFVKRSEQEQLKKRLQEVQQEEQEQATAGTAMPTVEGTAMGSPATAATFAVATNNSSHGECTDQDMPDVSDPDAGFVPTEDQPYRRLRRHTIT
jgi:hypothetical protein